jgi:hypothetical protein
VSAPVETAHATTTDDRSFLLPDDCHFGSLLKETKHLERAEDIEQLEFTEKHRPNTDWGFRFHGGFWLTFIRVGQRPASDVKIGWASA